MRALLVLAGLALVGCGGDAAIAARATAPLEPTVRDSAGVTIYEHPADALDRAPRWVVDSEALAVIGGDDEATDVSPMREAVLLSDGRLAAFHGRDAKLFIFGKDGALQREVGRKGAGPGEFGTTIVHLATVAGDTIVTSDSRNDRLTAIAPDTGVAWMRPGTFRLAFKSQPVAGRFANGDWILDFNDQIIASTGRRELPEPRESVALGVLRALGDSLAIDTLVVLPGTELAHFRYRFGGNVEEVTGTPVFGKRTHATAWNGMAAVAINESWEVRRYRSTGELASAVRVAGPLRQVTADLVARRAEDLRERVREMSRERGRDPAEALDEIEFSLAETPVASVVPAFSAMHRSPGRLLWLADMPVTWSDSMGFTALDPDGRIVARLLLPARTEVVAFGDDRIVIRTTDDETGIARLNVHRLVTP